MLIGMYVIIALAFVSLRSSRQWPPLRANGETVRLSR